jgi:hypothetical protein
MCLWYHNSKTVLINKLLNKATETNVSTAEIIVKCICLLHNINTDNERTTHDPTVQESSQILGSNQGKTNVTAISFSRTSKGATDVRNGFKAHFNRPIAPTLSQN